MKSDKYYSLKSSSLFFGIGVLFLGIRLRNFIPTMNLIYNGDKVTGTVTDLKVYKDDENGDTYQPTVRYTCGGRTVENSTSTSSSSYYYRVGSKITVYCNPKKPEKFYIKGSDLSFFIIFGFFAFLGGWLGIRVISKELKILVLKQRLKKEGVIVKAKVESVKTTRQGLQGYYITAKSGNDTYTSGSLSPSIKYLVKPGDNINVYVDIQDHTKYWIDSDSIRGKPIQGEYIKEKLLNEKGIEDKNYSTSYDKLIEHTEEGKALQKGISSNWLGMVLLFVFGGLLSLAFVYNTYEAIVRPKLTFDSGLIIFGIIGFGLLGRLFWMIYNKIKNKNLKKRLQREGIVVEGIITEIKDTGVRINNQPGYVIIALHGNELYKSPSIYKNVRNYLQKGDSVAIYIDSQDPKQYWMDIASVKSTKRKIEGKMEEQMNENSEEEIENDI